MNAPTINGAPFLLSAEPDGIQFFTAANGEPIPTEKITYTEAINRLDSGLYDDVSNMVAGFCVVYTITEGGARDTLWPRRVSYASCIAG